ncbi:hypothetical protein [Nocardia wallacei]|uniref:Uncharacterized protein n=2 Tax=Nocardia wallacei TaxID=480035 RepID=A0A7G1KYJ0_9NOCA|nr:hypothetical protein [Nocardia wallacei]BCK59313.1 hypothetical protein NWFMUON74_70850 [Nocardia wallacei]
MIARENGRTVVRLTETRDGAPARHAARRAARTPRHAPAPGRRVLPRTTATRSGRARHAAPARHAVVRRRPAHAGLDNYDRLLLWFAGWLLSVRIALVGEQPIDEN